MSSQHLSDEAVAAFADGVLSGHARERATRHAAGCAECAHAVAVQREAVWALRAAPAPPLPSGLLDRLRSVPSTTPITTVPTAVGPDGSAMFATFGAMTAAAFVPPQRADRPRPDTRRAESRAHRVRPIFATAAAVAVAGAVAVGSTGQASGNTRSPQRGPAAPAGSSRTGDGVPAVQPALLRSSRLR
jgi:anti-sigma factor RsiW